MFQNQDEAMEKRSSTPVLREREESIGNPFAQAAAQTSSGQNAPVAKINAVRGTTPTKKLSWKEAMQRAG